MIMVRPRPGVEIKCQIVGEYEHIFQSGGSLVNSRTLEAETNHRMAQMTEADEHYRLIYIDAFLADQFSRRVSQPYEYKLTAAYAVPVLKAGFGLMYPSIEVRGVINLAVSAETFSKNFEVLETFVVDVEKYYGHGIYKWRPCNQSNKFMPDGTIIWDGFKPRPYAMSLQGGLRPLDNAPGWTVPK
jgi:hypothetical protein